MAGVHSNLTKQVSNIVCGATASPSGEFYTLVFLLIKNIYPSIHHLSMLSPRERETFWEYGLRTCLSQKIKKEGKKEKWGITVTHMEIIFLYCQIKAE